MAFNFKHKYHFSGVREFTRYVQGAPRAAGALQHSQTASDNFNGGMSPSYAISVGLSGGALWTEGMNRMSKANDLGRALIRQAPIRIEGLDVAGHTVDICAWLAGEPCHMINEEEDETQVSPKIVRVGVVLGRSSSTTTEAAINRGAAIMSIIDELEDAGFRVELTGVFVHTSASWMTQITLKQAGEQWSPANVAFALCHPAFSRRLGFMMVESCEETVKVTHDSYGHAMDVTAETVSDEFDVFFPYCVNNGPWFTMERAIESARTNFSGAILKHQMELDK